MAIPRKDSILVPWTTNFATRTTSTPTVFGLTAPQATAYETLSEAYIDAYNDMMAARANGSRSATQTALKDAAKAALLVMARELYAFVSANTNVSDADKTALSVHVRSGGSTPTPPPTVRPGTDLVSVVGRIVTTNIHDSTSSSKRGKPAGCVAAWVYTYVGATYPSDPMEWTFQGAATKSKFEIVFPNSVAAGAQVWICAAWVNRRGEAGPTSVPITTNLQGGGVSVEALKMAA